MSGENIGSTLGSVPPGFCCPITMEIMHDPVVDAEGNTFERKAIEEWIKKHKTSPITRKKCKISQLKPNRALRDLIEDFVKQNPTATAPADMQPLAPPVEAGSMYPAVETAMMPTPEDLTPELQVYTYPGSSSILAQMIPKPGVTRSPIDVCCSVDISGSMECEARIASADGKHEGDGLSLLDVTKHAVKTVIHTLGPQDRLCIVEYDDNASVVYNLQFMTDKNKEECDAAVTNMQVGGCTNLWGGLHLGLEQLRTAAPVEGAQMGGHRVAAVLLLTDGLPNVVPPRGHEAMLRRYKDENNGLPASISTFGFGYSLDSPLLNYLAQHGNGLYSFIPDASFVGTVFVNALSNLLATTATNAELTVELPSGVKCVTSRDHVGNKKDKVDRVLGGLPVNVNSWGVSLKLASLQAGQERSQLLHLDGMEGKDVTVSLKVTHRLAQNPVLINARPMVTVTQDADSEAYKLFCFHELRLRTVDAIRHAIALFDSADQEKSRSIVTGLLKEFDKAPEDERITALREDVSGQFSEAVSREDWYRKWGKHYLQSLARAHQVQQCNNFKDPGVQVYGSALFHKMQDAADKIFVNLPPPVPTRRRWSHDSGGAGGASYAPVSMSRYYDSAGPCFAGEGRVLMDGGVEKRVDGIRKGDVLDGGSRVQCVVKTLTDRPVKLCVLPESGLRVTPWHPVKLQDQWVFPANVCPETEHRCNAVYNFLTDDRKAMKISGVECITLAHGDATSTVTAHDFYGTEAVTLALQRMPGFAEGEVALQAGCCVERDTQTHAVVGLVAREMLRAEAKCEA